MRDTSMADDTDPYEFDTADDTPFWKKDILSRVIAAPPGRSRWYMCACVFSVSFVLLLTLIISISLTKTQIDSRFSDVEGNVKNVTQSVVFLISRIQQLEERSNEVVQSLKEMRLSVNSLQTQSTDFFTEVNVVKAAVAQIKCRLDGLNKNSTEDQCCPLDWTLYFSHCYYFSDDGKSWNAARDECEKMQSELLVVKSKEEKDFVIKQIRSSYYWLGLSDERTGEWEWIDGTPYHMIRSEWMPGQPDNWDGHGLEGGEDCAHFHTRGRYNDDHCSTEHRYICKKHSQTL